MKRLIVVGLVAGALGVEFAYADLVTLEVKQTGGFYAGAAAPDNDPAFQNYFVGYGTSPGGMRTPERRSFFWFDLSGVGGEIHSATLHLKLIFGGLVFGKGPGDPMAGPVPSDPMETFQVGATPVPAGLVASPFLTPPMIAAVFDSFDSMPIAPPLDFVMGGMPPEDISISLDGTGLTLLEGAAGGDVVLTGWMPTWSFDGRMVGMPPMFFEGSELIFGFTDVHAGFTKPTLTIDFTPIPEASAALLLTATCLLVGGGYGIRRVW